MVTRSRKAPEPRFEVMEITPALAEEWLGHNSHNRPLRNQQVERLRGIIERGEWLMNGDAIRFDPTGTLLDGQHRLWGIVESGVTVRSLVGFDLPAETQQTIDMGARRKLSDVLSLRGETSTIILAATLNYIWRSRRGTVRRMERDMPSVAQALALFEENKAGIKYAITVAERVRSRLPVPTTVMAAAFLQFSALSDEDAEDFYAKLASGENLAKGSPILTLRRFLETNRQKGSRLQSVLIYAMTIKAWNAYREGRSVELLSFKMGGANPEAWPEPV